MLVSVGDTGFVYLPQAQMTYFLLSHFGSSSYYPYARMLRINHAQQEVKVVAPERTRFLYNKAKSDVVFWERQLKEATNPETIARNEAKLEEAKRALEEFEEDNKEFLRSLDEED